MSQKAGEAEAKAADEAAPPGAAEGVELGFLQDLDEAVGGQRVLHGGGDGESARGHGTKPT